MDLHTRLNKIKEYKIKEQRAESYPEYIGLFDKRIALEKPIDKLIERIKQRAELNKKSHYYCFHAYNWENYCTRALKFAKNDMLIYCLNSILKEAYITKTKR